MSRRRIIKASLFFLFILPVITLSCAPTGAELFGGHPGDPNADPGTPLRPRIPMPDRSGGFNLPPAHDPGRPDEPDMPLYATSMVLFGGCMQNPERVAVPKRHSQPAVCERVRAIPVMETDGEMLETGLSVTWESDDTDTVSLACLAGGSNCTLLGHADYFDLHGADEPMAWVTACSANNCPIDAPACKPVVCNALIADIVVNVEGDWAMEGLYLEDAIILMTQEGRHFEGETLVTDGMVLKSYVEFRIGDYAYIGTISPDRMGMSGDVIDLMSDTPVSTWSAVRLAAP